MDMNSYYQFSGSKKVLIFMVFLFVIHVLPQTGKTSDEVPDQISVEIQPGLPQDFVNIVTQKAEAILKGINRYYREEEFNWENVVANDPGIAEIEAQISGTDFFIPVETTSTFIHQATDDQYEVGNFTLATADPEKEAYKEFMIRLDADGNVIDAEIISGLQNIAPIIIHDTPASDDKAAQVLDDMEMFKNSYNHSDTLGIKQMIDSDALIIAASRLPGDRTMYRRHSLEGYTNLLQGMFDIGREADLRFRDPEILEHPQSDSIFGLRTRQIWYSSEGEELFMVIETRDEADPQIHFRVWTTSDEVFARENYPDVDLTPPAPELPELTRIGLRQVQHTRDDEMLSLAHRFDLDEGGINIELKNHSERELTLEDVAGWVKTDQLTFAGVTLNDEQLEIKDDYLKTSFSVDNYQESQQHVETIADLTEITPDSATDTKLYLQRDNHFVLQLADEPEQLISFPDPAVYGYHHIHSPLDEIEIQFYTEAGQLLKQETQTDESSINQLASGIYTIEIQSDDESFSEEVVIEPDKTYETDLSEVEIAVDDQREGLSRRAWILAATGAALIATGATMIFTGDTDDPPSIPGPPGRP